MVFIMKVFRKLFAKNLRFQVSFQHCFPLLACKKLRFSFLSSGATLSIKLWVIMATTLLQSFCCNQATAALVTDTNTSEKEETLQAQDCAGIAEARFHLHKYKELFFLTEASEKETQEGGTSSDDAYSLQIFGKKCKELDRTFAALSFFECIFQGSKEGYTKFVARQPASKRLSYDSFLALHHQLRHFINSGFGEISPQELKEAFCVSIVLGDLGKSGTARKKLAEYMDHQPEDHDEFLAAMLTALKTRPTLLPSYARLSSKAQLVLQKHVPVHLGHVSHMEGTPWQMLRALKESAVLTKNPEAFTYAVLGHWFDVMAAAGHVSPTSSLTFTEPCYQRMNDVFASLKRFSEGNITEQEVALTYLEKTAKRLAFDVTTADGKMLTRIACMLRFYDPLEGEMLYQAFSRLSPEKQEQLEQAFSLDNPIHYKTPTYVPAVLINAYKNRALGSSPQERLNQVFAQVLPLIAMIEKDYENRLLEQSVNAVDPLCFNQVAGYMTTYDPEIAHLSSARWLFDAGMNVHIQKQ